MAKKVSLSTILRRPPENVFLGVKTLRKDKEALQAYLGQSIENLTIKDHMESTLQLAMCENLLGGVSGRASAKSLLNQCEDYIMAHGRDKERACIFHIKATECILDSDYSGGLAASVRALHLFQQQEMTFYAMDTAIRCGISCFFLNMTDEGLQYLTQAESLALSMQGEKDVITYLSNIEDNRIYYQSPADGIRRNEELLERIEKEYHGEPVFLLVNIYLRFSSYYVLDGHADKGGLYADMGLELIGQFTNMPNYLPVLCYLHLNKIRHGAMTSDEGTMIHHADIALQMADTSQTFFVKMQVFGICCRFYLERGDLSRAKKYLDKVDDTLPENEQSKLYLDKLELHCLYHKAAGETAEELRYFQQVHDYKMKAHQEAVANRMKYMTTLYELELSRQELIRQRQELDHKNEELNMAAYHLQQRNDLLNDLKDNLLEQAKQGPKAEPTLKKISRVIERALVNEEEEKERIREKFDEAHSAYITRLHQTYPALSPTECRLCALLKSGFNTKEISNLLSTSIRNVENHRTRIRKKLNLKKEDNLNLKLTEIG